MKILVAVEDKEFGEAIADFVCNHTWPDKSEFRILHVVEPLYLGAVHGYSSNVLTSYMEERHRAGKSLVLTLGTTLRTRFPEMPIKEEVIDGHPKEVIIDTARDWPADVIIVGSHGRAGLSQFFLGSVSMSVLSHAPCSVLVVKRPDKNASGSTRDMAGELARK